MDPALHKAAVQGSVATLRKLVTERPGVIGSKTPQGNTVLHIAAELGNAGFVQATLGVDYELLVTTNADGDTPLHLAARAGKVDVAELLISPASAWPAEHSPASQQGPLLMANKAGDTPLHEAVKQGRSTVALMLLAAEPSRAHAVNMKQQSPLHIAAREGLADVVAKILSQPWVHERFVPSDSIGGTALHQAVLGGHIRVLEMLLHATGQEQIGMTDSSENNALHYATQKNNARVVKLLLNRKLELAYKRNRNLESPLHVAAYYGSTEAMVELLKQCPDAVEMVDSNGRNAFHVAVTSGKVDALRCLLKQVRPAETVNGGDHQGNTPLHLAAAMSRVQLALLLLKDRRVSPCVLNRDGQSVRSLIEKRAATDQMADVYEMYVWKKLKKCEASSCKNMQLPPPPAPYRSLRGQGQAAGHDEFNVTMLVATLIATVSFAASFTMPGGYNQTEGTAIHGHKAAFKIFLVSNTVAMCSSIVVVFCPTMWAWRERERDPVEHKLDQLNWRRRLMWSRRLTNVAFLAMLVSFMTAVYITVAPTARWPSYLVIAIVASTPVLVFLTLWEEM